MQQDKTQEFKTNFISFNFHKFYKWLQLFSQFYDDKFFVVCFSLLKGNFYKKSIIKMALNRNVENLPFNEDFWFPGRWVGGTSMILAPILFLVGMLLRMQYHFFFPQQLQAFRDHPTLIITSYNFFIVGNILLCPAVITLVRIIRKRNSQLALWGGMFVILGLFARTFQGGINHLAFQLVNIQGLELATKTIAASYGAFNIIATLNGTIMFGWLILAIGSCLSGTLGLFRSIALGLMAALMSGVLKGTSLFSIVAAAGLCVALVPIGFKVLKDGPMPSFKAVASWTLVIIILVTILYFLGQSG